MFKEENLEISSLLKVKYEFYKKDIYAFSFANDKELKYFIENVNVHDLPDKLITLMY